MPHAIPFPSFSHKTSSSNTTLIDNLSILNNDRSQPLRILNIDRLHIRVKLLLRALLIIALPRNPHPKSVRHAFDPGFPDFLVELRVKTDVFGALDVAPVVLIIGDVW